MHAITKAPMTKDSAPAKSSIYLTRRLDFVNSMAKQLGTRTHEHLLGLTEREVRLVLVIQERPGLNIGELIEASFLEKTIVSRGVTHLSRLGYVSRSVGETDARQFRLNLTRKGEAIATRAGAITTEGIEKILSVLTPDEQSVFSTVLDKLSEKMKADLAVAPEVEHKRAPRKPRLDINRDRQPAPKEGAKRASARPQRPSHNPLAS